MIRFPPDLYAAGFVIAGTLVLLFVDAAYAMRLQPRGAKVAVLCLFAVGLLALAVLPDVNVITERLAFTSFSTLFAAGVTCFALRGGHLNQVNGVRGSAFVVAAAYLLWASLFFFRQDFGSAWSDAQFRLSGGQGALVDLILVFTGKSFDFLGAKTCAALSAAAAGLSLRKAFQLLHLPDLDEADRVLKAQFGSVSMTPPPSLSVSERPNQEGTVPKYWWHRYVKGDWRDPRCRALLRVYARLGGPYFPGSGIPLKEGFLQLDRDVINRHLEAGSLKFHEPSGRFGLTGRGYAILNARE